MKLITYTAPAYFGDTARAGVMEGEWVRDLGSSLQALLEAGPAALTEARARAAVVIPLGEARLLAPLPQPRSLRDFYAFEQHVRECRAKRGQGVQPEWYQFPVFYFSNVTSICGPEEPVARPAYTRELDFELEVAAVIGRTGRDIPADQADDYIAGYMILNDWSARDVQRREMKVGLGPAKGKDFANSIGPWLATPDELADRRIPGPRGDRHNLTMIVRVNGKEYGRGNLQDLHFTFGEMIARASEAVTLYPGEIVASGTVGTGCLLETELPWLEPGDIVEMEVERLGVLRNRVV